MSINEPRRPQPDRYPQLRQFASGYLHQDFGVEHGTAADARAAFLADASDTERQAFLDESARFLAAFADRPWVEARAAWAALGAAWRPSSRAALHALLGGQESSARPAERRERRPS